MNELKSLETLKSIPGFSWTQGPESDEILGSDWKAPLDDYFGLYPRLASLSSYVEFVYHCPEFSISQDQEEEPDFTDEKLSCLDFGPISDEYMQTECQEGIFKFAVSLMRYRPPLVDTDYLDGLATCYFAIQFAKDRFIGISARIVSPLEHETSWTPHSRNFSDWLSVVKSNKGRMIFKNSENTLQYLTG